MLIHTHTHTHTNSHKYRGIFDELVCSEVVRLSGGGVEEGCVYSVFRKPGAHFLQIPRVTRLQIGFRKHPVSVTYRHRKKCDQGKGRWWWMTDSQGQGEKNKEKMVRENYKKFSL